ncbi:glutathione S-transferase domain-containing protein [Caballeronia fortuita]|uniref:Glutathione S-transferase domain-containing protein n=1 Tax=Caballeronia fortuita TaxID=1777138 RepID=A0A158CTK0_9BURK|nr:glutathione S-transferase family protein [Caballeronia fortuita]SAK85530.1 glutathione S-transferase domain-containing protein [Caballeronia fortuita]
MKLYFTPGVCSQAPHIVLREADIEFELVEVNLATKRTSSGEDFANVNPLGYVPVLEVGEGFALREGPAIMQYIADLAPNKYLLPLNGSNDRYRAHEWLNFLTTEIHKGFVPLIYERKMKRFADFAAYNKPKIEKSFALVDKHLAGKEFVMGNTYTAVDSYLWVLCNWGKAPWINSVFDADVDLTHLENLRDWHERIAARPAVADAVAAEWQAARPATSPTKG